MRVSWLRRSIEPACCGVGEQGWPVSRSMARMTISYSPSKRITGQPIESQHLFPIWNINRTTPLHLCHFAPVCLNNSQLIRGQKCLNLPIY